MHKSQLITTLAEELKVSQHDSSMVVNSFFETISEGLAGGERTEIRGLGSFRVKEYPGYSGRNPKTGVAIDVPPKRLPFFRVGRELRAVVASEKKATNKK